MTTLETVRAIGIIMLICMKVLVFVAVINEFSFSTLLMIEAPLLISFVIVMPKED